MAKKNQYFPQTVTHPGEELQEMLEELKMGSKEFAVRTNKPEKTISAILNGNSSITPEMAVIFENVLKVPAHYWLSRQRHYDEALARAAAENQLKESLSWANQFPIRELQKLGWLPPLNSKEEATQALLTFFGLSNKTAWEAYYFERRLKASFRISLYGTKSPYALSAWLRQGEITAKLQTVAPFYASILKKKLPQFKKLMIKHPEDFFEGPRGQRGIFYEKIPSLGKWD